MKDTCAKASLHEHVNRVDPLADEPEVQSEDGKYRGQWTNGAKHGFGQFKTKSCSYKGNWYKDTMHGQGVMTWDDGRIYRGQFLSNKFHGYASMKFPNNIRYVGHYANGLKHGIGAVYWDDSLACWSGQWVNGKRHGEGVYTDPDGKVMKGMWSNDQFDYETFSEVKVDKEKLEGSRLPPPQDFNGVWLCSHTFVEMCRIQADGNTFGKLTWTNKDVKCKWFDTYLSGTSNWFNTTAHLESNSDGRLLCKIHDQFVGGELQDKKLVWEDGEVWFRGPSDKSPQEWRVIDKGGAIIRASCNLENKPKQVGKLKKEDVITVIDVKGRRAQLLTPTEGWISIMTHDEGGLPGLEGKIPAGLPGGKPFQIAMPSGL